MAKSSLDSLLDENEQANILQQQEQMIKTRRKSINNTTNSTSITDTYQAKKLLHNNINNLLQTKNNNKSTTQVRGSAKAMHSNINNNNKPIDLSATVDLSSLNININNKRLTRSNSNVVKDDIAAVQQQTTTTPPRITRQNSRLTSTTTKTTTTQKTTTATNNNKNGSTLKRTRSSIKPEEDDDNNEQEHNCNKNNNTLILQKRSQSDASVVTQNTNKRQRRNSKVSITLKQVNELINDENTQDITYINNNNNNNTTTDIINRTSVQKLELLYDNFHLSSIQYRINGLVGREYEYSKIKTWLINNIKNIHNTNTNNDYNNNISKSLYISGLPGIGKTATIDCLLHNLFNISIDRQQSKINENIHNNNNNYNNSEHKLLQNVKVIYINALNISNKDNKYIFTTLYEQLTNHSHTDNPTINDKYTMLQQYITSKSCQPILCIIDEIDCLLPSNSKTNTTQNNNIVTQLYSLCNTNNSNLRLIGLSNNSELPAYIHNIYGIQNIDTIQYTAYTMYQLNDIIQQRIDQSNINYNQYIEPMSIEYLCRIIEKYNSDIRRCFDILKQAISQLINMYNNNQQCNIKINLPMIAQLTKQVTSNERMAIQAIQSLPPQQQLLLTIATIYQYTNDQYNEHKKLHNITHSKTKYTTVYGLRQYYIDQSIHYKLPCLNTTEYNIIFSQLCGSGHIVNTHKTIRIEQNINTCIIKIHTDIQVLYDSFNNYNKLLYYFLNKALKRIDSIQEEMMLQEAQCDIKKFEEDDREYEKVH